ncbi:MAG: hypothetical protein K940chlam8_00255 [Chlamydiae bacterium]|nr:hypothetical protein [Chlamydiota bacterium]
MIYILVSLFFSSVFFIMSMENTENVKTESFLLKQMQDYRHAENKIENKKQSALFSRMTQLEKVKSDGTGATPRHVHRVNLRALFKNDKAVCGFLVDWIDATYQDHFKRKVGKVFTDAILKYYHQLSLEDRQNFKLHQLTEVPFKNQEDRIAFLKMLKGSRALRYVSFFDLFTLNDLPTMYFYHCSKKMLSFLFSEEQRKLVKNEYKRVFKEKQKPWSASDCIQRMNLNVVQKKRLTLFSFEFNHSSKKERVFLEKEKDLPLKRKL